MNTRKQTVGGTSRTLTAVAALRSQIHARKYDQRDAKPKR